MPEWKRGGLTQEILDKHYVLAGGVGDTPDLKQCLRPKVTNLSCWEDDEWYCILPEITVHDPGMDWVDLPLDHVYREGDEYFSLRGNEYEPAMAVIGEKVGDTISGRGRCRRQDLPPQKRKIVLTEWLARVGTDWYRYVQTEKPDSDEVIRIKDHEYEVDAQ